MLRGRAQARSEPRVFKPNAVATRLLAFWATAADLVHHAMHPPTVLRAVEYNTRIPASADAPELLAFVAKPKKRADGSLPILVLIHEFYGLNPSITEKATVLADELGCLVIAPDTFRGQSTTFIPKAIWLTLTTPQERVNDDLDRILEWAAKEDEVDPVTSKVAVMGFCYGGGKAIRYTTQRKPSAATVVCYGSPVTSVAALAELQAPVCGVFGSEDFQFPPSTLDAFRKGLTEAGVDNDVRVYDGVGHAFLSDLELVRRGEEPQAAAW
eukprot:CAMPEP_0170189862 /NCGR_PEP_ID=MMETSP0040_2-20121228/47884_1 /TAXON_ID=641309 /ORGANISM="Lotharella oceanica, Strain CCMP622" /LENGTH=268 /DNA_ID=CAMNT_0010437553 /DNA_START=74 /DNA_END=877 /DNA_ORIENTATION=+